MIRTQAWPVSQEQASALTLLCAQAALDHLAGIRMIEARRWLQT